MFLTHTARSISNYLSLNPPSGMGHPPAAALHLAMLPVDLDRNPNSVFQLDNLGLASSLKTCLMIWLTLSAVTGPVLLTLLRCHGKVPSAGRALPCLLYSHPRLPGIQTCICLPAYKKLHFGAILQFTSYQFVLPLKLFCHSGKLLWDTDLPVLTS